MKRGWPPTDRKARTGLFTPPGMSCWASLKSFADRVVFITGGAPYHAGREPVKKFAMKSALLIPARNDAMGPKSGLLKGIFVGHVTGVSEPAVGEEILRHRNSLTWARFLLNTC
jgi:hypothetical protein